MGDGNLEAGRTHQLGGFQSKATAISRSEGLRSIPLAPGLIHKNTKSCVRFSKKSHRTASGCHPIPFHFLCTVTTSENVKNTYLAVIR